MVAAAIIALLTFMGVGGVMSPTKHLALFIVYYLVNGAMLVVYLILQVILVLNTLDDRWPLGDIVLGTLFFAAGQTVMLVLSQPLCVTTSHYMDGLFFGHVFTLLAVMMVYKYWDSITKDDLEFSVGGKMNNWEVKEDFDGASHIMAEEEEFMLPVGGERGGSGSGTNTPREKNVFGEGIGVGYEKTRYGL